MASSSRLLASLFVLAAVWLATVPARWCFLSINRRQVVLGLPSVVMGGLAPAAIAKSSEKQKVELPVITKADEAEIYASTTRARSIVKEIASSVAIDPVPNDSGSFEKHTPQIKLTGDGGVVFSVPHPMDPGVELDGEVEVGAHYIEYMWFEDPANGRILGAKAFEATDPSPPTLATFLPKGVKAVPYLYCNLHGLWKGKEFTV